MLILTNRQVELLVKYTNPYSEFEKQLKEASNSPDKPHHKLTIDEHFTNLLLGDLVYYSKPIEDDYLLEEIDDLYSVLESSI